MPGQKSYGPGGKWIHDRAKRLQRKNPDMEERTAFAVATQQAHKVGKSPKKFRTAEGMRTAKSKFSLPKKEYRKTAGLLQPEQPRAKEVIKGRGPKKREARAKLRDKFREGCESQKTASLAGFFDELEKIAQRRALVAGLRTAQEAAGGVSEGDHGFVEERSGQEDDGRDREETAQGSGWLRHGQESQATRFPDQVVESGANSSSGHGVMR